jgi:hypothetical protein
MRWWQASATWLRVDALGDGEPSEALSGRQVAARHGWGALGVCGTLQCYLSPLFWRARRASLVDTVVSGWRIGAKVRRATPYRVDTSKPGRYPY